MTNQYLGGSPLRIATRQSALALWQARHVQAALGDHFPGLAVELVPMTTRGDQILDRSLSKIGGKGLFLKELEVAMLDERADIAVHSLKDVPAELESGLGIGAFLPRANPADAWIAAHQQTIESIAAGSRVGTSSLRRQAQVLAVRPDLKVVELRGNVDTRLRKLDEGQYDAIILAAAGLERLGLQSSITSLLEAPDWLPAPGQGTIAIEARMEDQDALELISRLNDPATQVTALAERALSHALDASCQLPLGAIARLSDDRLRLHGMLSALDGRTVVSKALEGVADEPEHLGRQLAAALLSSGGAAILESLGHPIPDPSL